LKLNDQSPRVRVTVTGGGKSSFDFDKARAYLTKRKRKEYSVANMKVWKAMLMIVLIAFVFQGKLIPPVHAEVPYYLKRIFNPALLFTPTPTTAPSPTPIVIIVTATPTQTPTAMLTPIITEIPLPTATTTIATTSLPTEQVSGTPTPTPLPQSTGMTNIEKVLGIGFIIVLFVLLQSKWAAIRSWIHEKTK
jgi:hypothetical protein